MAISVVMGTYNGASYVAEQMDSLLSQTLPPIEIIVADDRSSDDTVAIVEAIARRSAIPILIRVNEHNLGYRDNFIEGTKSASGDLVAFCDQDDVWRPDKLAICAGAFTDPDVVLAVHTARTIDGDGRPMGRFTQGISGSRTVPPLAYQPWQSFFGFSMVFRRALFELVPADRRGPDFFSEGKRIAHDCWILFLANIAGKTREIDIDLADYRQHGANLYGAAASGDKLGNAARIRTISRLYLAAAVAEQALVEAIVPSAAAPFGPFDKARANAWWADVVRKRRDRDRVYDARSRVGAMARLVGNLIRGTYRTTHSRRFDYKPLVKDILFLGLPRGDGLGRGLESPPQNA